MFYDPEWDGLPDNENTEPPAGNTYGKNQNKNGSTSTAQTSRPPRPGKIVVELSNGRKLKVLDIETCYIDESGKPLTTKQFLEKLIGFIPDLYRSEDHLRQIWSKPETREELLLRLADSGMDEEQLDSLRKIFEAENSDIFDILLHISYDGELITRSQRAFYTKEDKAFFDVYENLKARDFLKFVLERYEADGIKELKRERLAALVELNNLGTTKDAARVFGGIQKLIDAFYKLQEHLYAS